MTDPATHAGEAVSSTTWRWAPSQVWKIGNGTAPREVTTPEGHDGFRDFYLLYFPRLVRFLISLARETTWAEDIAQDTMLVAYDKWAELLTYERPHSWLFKVAIRKLRRMESRGREWSSLQDFDTIISDMQVVAATDEWVDRHVDLMAGIRSLPRRQAEVIALHYLADYTIVETAEILGIYPGSAKSHLHRALDRLRHLAREPNRGGSA